MPIRSLVSDIYKLRGRTMQFGASASVAATSIEGIRLRSPHSLRPCTVRMRQFEPTSGESIFEAIDLIRNGTSLSLRGNFAAAVYGPRSMHTATHSARSSRQWQACHWYICSQGGKGTSHCGNLEGHRRYCGVHRDASLGNGRDRIEPADLRIHFCCMPAVHARRALLVIVRCAGARPS